MSLWIPQFPLRSQVLAEIKKHFPPADIAFILEVLNLYGNEPGEEHCEWMHIFLVQHARGDVDLLLRSIEEAKRGYKKFLKKVYSDELGRVFAENPSICTTLFPYEPPERPLSRREAVEAMGVPWREFDRWVEEWKLRPLRQPGPTVFAVEDLERLQREREREEAD